MIKQAMQTLKQDGVDRDHVTPDALTVSAELLGLALATPRQRALALACDGMVLALLASFGLWLLGPLLLGMAFWLWFHPQRDVPLNGSRWVAVFLVGVALLFLAGTLGAESLTSTGPAPVGGDKGAPGLLGFIDEAQWATWAAVYFTAFPGFWQGQTPGKRLLGIRVRRLNGAPMTLWESFGRYGGYAAGFATGLLGFAQVYWDHNRQAIHDKIAATVVLREN